MTKCYEQALADHAEPGYHWALGGDGLGFSWQPCDGCGTKLAGDRYRINLLPDNGPINDDTILPIAVCVDCLRAHANGDMPEYFCEECQECKENIANHGI